LNVAFTIQYRPTSPKRQDGFHGSSSALLGPWQFGERTGEEKKNERKKGEVKKIGGRARQRVEAKVLVMPSQGKQGKEGGGEGKEEKPLLFCFPVFSCWGGGRHVRAKKKSQLEKRC